MKITSSLEKLIQDFDLIEFMTQNKHKDPVSFLLRSKGNDSEWNRLLATQLKIYPKASGKVPHFTDAGCWFTDKSYEQASGERTALYKQRLLKGTRLLDLSGGLGVDDWALSAQFDEIISLDPDHELNFLVKINMAKLGIQNVNRLSMRAEDYLQQDKLPSFSAIYLDADRRPDASRTFNLHQVQPDFLAMKEKLFACCSEILLKVSPMADLQYLKKEIPEIYRTEVLGLQSEVKELLLFVRKNYSGPMQVAAVVLTGKEELLRFEPESHETINAVAGGDYFFEPHAVIIKAGLSRNYAAFLGLHQIAPNTAFYKGNNLPQPFLGRAFSIQSEAPYHKKNLLQYLKEKNIQAANISARNFGETADEIRKQLRLADGGDDFLFFYKDSAGKRQMLLGKKAITRG